MATGLTLSRLSEDQHIPGLRAYHPRPSTLLANDTAKLYKSDSAMEEGKGGQTQSGNARSPWIRLFRLFQSKHRAEAQQQENTSGTNSSKVKQKKDSTGSGGLTVEVITKARKNSKEEEPKVKKNIYRRPSSRAIFNPRLSRGAIGDSCCTQKYSRRKSDPVEDPHTYDDFVDSCDGELMFVEGRFRRPRSRSVPAIPQGPAFRRRMELGRKPSPRHTNFQEDVNVMYYEEDRKTSVRNLCENTHLHDINEVSHSEDTAGPSEAQPSDQETSKTDDSNFKSPKIVITPGGCQSIDVPPTFNVGKSRRGVRLMIELDKECLRKRTCVRAMSGGRTLIVLTYNAVPESDTEVTEHSNRINLPVTIDPFSVKANVLKSGHLCIEAPLRKDSI